MSNWIWFQRRWWEFKRGDSGYLRYIMSFFQFILLTYTLGVERFTFLADIFSHIWIYTIVFFLCYIPAAIFIGSQDRKKQYLQEYLLAIEQNKVSGYSNLMSMTLWIEALKKLGVEIPEEYYELREWWKKIAGDWKPPI